MATFIVGIIIALVKGWKLALVILSTTPLLAGCGAVMMIVSQVCRRFSFIELILQISLLEKN